MIKQINSFNHKGFLILAICLIASSSVFAASEKNNLLITQNLSKKLQSDLASEAVEVKLNNVEEYKVSRNEIGLKGDATCIVANENNQLPIQFDIKVNAANQSILDIKYEFVENTSSYAPTTNEDVLMKELMKKISQDYRTENIIIAIDAVENVGSINNEKKFLGVGEVRIGDLIWNKIKFDVEIDAKTQKANKIIYKVEK